MWCVFLQSVFVTEWSSLCLMSKQSCQCHVLFLQTCVCFKRLSSLPCSGCSRWGKVWCPLWTALASADHLPSSERVRQLIVVTSTPLSQRLNNKLNLQQLQILGKGKNLAQQFKRMNCKKRGSPPFLTRKIGAVNFVLQETRQPNADYEDVGLAGVAGAEAGAADWKSWLLLVQEKQELNIFWWISRPYQDNQQS